LAASSLPPWPVPAVCSSPPLTCSQTSPAWPSCAPERWWSWPSSTCCWCPQPSPTTHRWAWHWGGAAAAGARRAVGLAERGEVGRRGCWLRRGSHTPCTRNNCYKACLSLSLSLGRYLPLDTRGEGRGGGGGAQRRQRLDRPCKGSPSHVQHVAQLAAAASGADARPAAPAAPPARPSCWLRRAPTRPPGPRTPPWAASPTLSTCWTCARSACPRASCASTPRRLPRWAAWHGGRASVTRLACAWPRHAPPAPSAPARYGTSLQHSLGPACARSTPLGSHPTAERPPPPATFLRTPRPKCRRGCSTCAPRAPPSWCCRLA
jgi:hypothetical protein